MSATRYLVQINGQTLVQRSRKEQAMPVYTAEAENTANLVELVTNTGKVLLSNRPAQLEITHTVEVSAPILETLEEIKAAVPVEEPKEPVTAPETTDDALEFLKAEIAATTAKRAALAAGEPADLPLLNDLLSLEPATDTVPLTKRPKTSSTYTINISGQPSVHVAGLKPKANTEFDLQVKLHPAAIITMTTAKGNQVRFYDGPLVQAKAVNEANPTAPLVTPERPSQKKTAPAAPKAPARKTAPKRVKVAAKAAAPARKAAKKATAKKTVLVKVDGRKNPSAPRWTSAPGQVRDQVRAFLDAKENINKSFTSVEIMHALNRDNGVNNISTTMANDGRIAWASRPELGETKRFTSTKSTRLLKKLGLLPEKKATASK